MGVSGGPITLEGSGSSTSVSSSASGRLGVRGSIRYSTQRESTDTDTVFALEEQVRQRPGSMKYELDKNEQGTERIPTTKRRCTDVFWLVLLVIYFIGMIVVATLGFVHGDPERLVYGEDHEGNLCGGPQYPGQKYVSYPRATEDVLDSGILADPTASISFYGVCVTRCPLAGEFVCTTKANAIIDASPEDREDILDACVTSWFAVLPFGDNCPDETIHDECFQVPMDTAPFFFRCLPEYVLDTEVVEDESGCIRYRNVTDENGDPEEICEVYREVTKVTREEPTGSTLLIDQYNSLRSYIKAVVGDIVKAYKVILTMGVGVSTVVGGFFIASLWCCVGVVVWATVWLTVMVAIAFTLYCYIKAGLVNGEFLVDVYNSLGGAIAESSNAIESFSERTNGTVSPRDGGANSTQTLLPMALLPSEDYVDEFSALAYFSTFLTFILIVAVILMFDRLKRAIKIFRVASTAIRKNLGLLMLPFISMLWLSVVAGAWLVCTAYVASAGTTYVSDTNQTISLASRSPKQVTYTESWPQTNFLVAYMFFGLLWILNFSNAVTVLTLSGAVLEWFWISHVGGASRAERNRWPITNSWYVTIRYHLGTAAFGGLILAFIQFIRYLAIYLERRLASVQGESRTIKAITWVLHCFLACLQRLVEFVSRNAYIYTAMYGTNFCASTKGAFISIASNLGQVALVTFLGDIIQRFGQILIALSSALCTWMYLDNSEEFQFGGDNQLNSFVAPVLAAMFLGWFIGAEVLAAFDITVDTILLSFCQDRRLKRLKAGHEQVTPPDVQEFVQEYTIKDPKVIKQLSKSTLI